MKLLIIMASRNNPTGLLATISSLIGLSSRKHDIIIKVGIDDDDTASLAYIPAIKNIYSSVQFIIVERKPTLGAIINELAKNENADVYIPLTDRMVVLTPDWDNIIGHASMHFFNHVLWWTMPEGTIMPIITRKWYEAYEQIFTEYFPFWFDDTWLAEVNCFVHGTAGYALPVSMWRKPGGVTKRCHDMRFWMDYFIEKRAERLIQAQKVTEFFGLKDLPTENMIQANSEMQKRDSFWNYKWRDMEKEFGDSSPRDETYLAAAKLAGWTDKDVMEAKNRE